MGLTWLAWPGVCTQAMNSGSIPDSSIMDLIQLALKGADPLEYIVAFFKLGLLTNFASRKMIGQMAGPVKVSQKLWKITMDYLDSLGAITRASLEQTRVELDLPQLVQAINNVEAPRQMWGFLQLAMDHLSNEELGLLLRNTRKFSYRQAENLLSYTIRRMAQIKDVQGDLHAFFLAIATDTVSYERLSPRVLGVLRPELTLQTASGQPPQSQTQSAQHLPESPEPPKASASR